MPVRIKNNRIFDHNRTHERVHADVEGAEIFDVTKVNGIRRPQETTVGHFSLLPEVEVTPSDDFNEVMNVELGEGFTEFIAEALVRVEPRLGKRLMPEKNAYTPWLVAAREIQQTDPELFAVITEAGLVEATPNRPDAKKEALMRMHAIADRRLGMPGALDVIFKDDKEIHDVHVKNS